jgi:hypothetical protein
MTKSTLQYVKSGIVAAAIITAQGAFAGSTFHPALDVQGAAGYFTYKSKYVLSNDTGLRYDYQSSIYAGDSRNFSIMVRGNMQSANFELVTKKLESSTTDVIIRYYLGPVYFGPAVGISNIAYSEGGGTPTFDLSERHYGGNAGVEFAAMRNGMVRLDVLATMQYDAKEVSNQTIELGTRIEADLGIEIPISKRFRIITGAKYIMYSVASQAETITMPYGGLKGEFDF